MADIVVVTETRVDVVTVTGSGTTDSIQVTGDKQIEVLTVGVQGPQGPGSVLTPATTTTLGGIIVGDNLSINANGLLSAQAVSLPNITHGVSSIRHAFSGPNRTIAGDVFNGGNKTGYAGFETNNGSLSRYTAGQMLNVGTDERQSYFQSTENGITFGAYRVTNDANGSPVYQFYRSFFQVSSQGFSSAVFDQNFNQALFNVTPTGTQIDAGGAGVLELTGGDVTVDTNQATPEPLSVLNRTMGDARYARLVVSVPR